VKFATSYLIDNTWVSGSEGTVKLRVNATDSPLVLNINKAILGIKLAADHKGAADGIIAGVLDTEEFIAEFRKFLGYLGLCDDSVFDGIANQIRGASDIMKDGSQDPSKTCDGISIGLGFEANEVQLGAVAPPAVPEQDPCVP
jgi:hypothetical protein